MRAFEDAAHNDDFRPDVDYGVLRVRRGARDPAALLLDATARGGEGGEAAKMARVMAAEHLTGRNAYKAAGRVKRPDVASANLCHAWAAGDPPDPPLRGVTLPFGRVMGMPPVLPAVSQVELLGGALASVLLPWRAMAALRARREVRAVLPLTWPPA